MNGALNRIISGIQIFTFAFSAISFVMPASVMAEDNNKYVLYDTFDKRADGKFDTCGWEIGESNDGYSAVFPASHWAEPDMVLVTVPRGGNSTNGNQSVIRKDLETPIDLTKNRAVLEVVMSTDTTAGLNIDFGYNRPKEISELFAGEFENKAHTIFRLSASGNKNSAGQNVANINLLNPSHGLTSATNFAAATGTPSATDGKPGAVFQDDIKVKVIFDYENELISYYITMPDGGTYTRDGWDDRGNMRVNGECPKTIESLDISSWCSNGSKFWIDSVKLYTLDPVMNETPVDGNAADFSDGYKINKSASTVIEAEFETSDAVDDATMVVNYHAAGAVEKNNVNIPLENIQSNTAYSVKITTDNIEGTAVYDIYQSGEETPVNSDPIEITGIDFTKFDIVDSISAENISLQNVLKIYNQKAVVNAGLYKKNGEYIYHLGDIIKLSFDAPIDETKVTDFIEFYCGSNKQDVLGDYDKTTGEYSFSLDGYSSGNWNIILNNELIYNNENADMSFLQNIMEFRYIGSTKPEVRNVRISGQVNENSEIIPSYEYIQAEDVSEGDSIHEWYMSDTFDGTYEKIEEETNKTLTVKSYMAGKYIKYSITPVTEDGAVGERVYSENVIAPPVPPFATNEAIKGTPAVGATLTLDYDFNDANEDEEGSSEYQWYISDSPDGDFTPIDGADRKNYRVSAEAEGKYIMASVVPKSSIDPKCGEIAYTDPTGKIGKLDEMTNLVQNADFEKGNITGWSIFNFASGDGVFLARAEDSEPAIGNYSMFVKGKTSASHTYISPSFTLKGGKTYIAGGKVYPTNGTMSNIYARTNTLTGVTLKTPFKTTESVSAAANKWTPAYTTWVAEGSVCSDSRVMLQSDTYTENFYVDDVYVGELEISDIQASFDKTEIAVPKNGADEITISNVQVINQIGTTNGLTEEVVYWELADDYPGVSIDGEKIIISDRATAGDIAVLAVCEPQFIGHNAERVECEYTIKLLPHDDTLPKVTDVTVTGASELNETIKGSYDFYQVNGYADASIYKWMVSDTEDGVYTEIPGENDINYTVTAATAGKYIKLIVTPYCAEGITGVPTQSNIACARIAPEARNLAVEGEHTVGSKIIGRYDFFDANMDKEGTSVYRWLVSDEPDGTYTPIENAVSSEYTLTKDEANKYVKFEVTPVSENIPYAGKAYLSQPFAGPKTPEARNVKITANGARLTGSYEYYHEYSVPEGNSKYEWILNGRVISNEISILANFSGTVTFKVAPVAASEPNEGESVSVSRSVSVGGSGSSSGGSGGGGGGGSSRGDTILSVEGKLPNSGPVIDESAAQKSYAVDLNNHWSKEYAENMISAGIMANDSLNTFNPERIATRAEIITWFAKSAGIEPVEYTNEFNDVSVNDDFAKYLQAMVNEGIISHDTNFRPNDNITREELCKVLYITINNRGKLAVNDDVDISKFADKADISEWAVNYVDGILDSGLMIGTSDTEFTPSGICTKAQLAVVLTRLKTLLGE